MEFEGALDNTISLTSCYENYENWFKFCFCTSLKKMGEKDENTKYLTN